MQIQTTEEAVRQDEWTLDADQMIFMLQHHNAVAAAFEADDLTFLRDLAGSEAYKAVFGTMSFDEAYDRYECMLEAGRGDT